MLKEGIKIIFDLETPHVELKVYPSKWENPLQVISFMDTGAATLILDPNIIHGDKQIPHWHSIKKSPYKWGHHIAVGHFKTLTKSTLPDKTPKL